MSRSWLRALAAVLAVFLGVLPNGTTAAAARATFTYDVPTVARLRSPGRRHRIRIGAVGGHAGVVCPAVRRGPGCVYDSAHAKQRHGVGASKSTVSRICTRIDADVHVLRTRRLDHQPFVYVWLDATYVHVRENRRVVSKATVIATGLRADGHREVLGLDVGDIGDRPGSHGARRHHPRATHAPRILSNATG